MNKNLIWIGLVGVGVFVFIWLSQKKNITSSYTGGLFEPYQPGSYNVEDTYSYKDKYESGVPLSTIIQEDDPETTVNEVVSKILQSGSATQEVLKAYEEVKHDFSAVIPQYTYLEGLLIESIQNKSLKELNAVSENGATLLDVYLGKGEDTETPITTLNDVYKTYLVPYYKG